MKADKFKESLAYCAEFVTHCIEIGDFEVSNCDSLNVDIRVAGLSFIFYHSILDFAQSEMNQIELNKAQIDRVKPIIEGAIPNEKIRKMDILREEISMKQNQLKQLENELH